MAEEKKLEGIRGWLAVLAVLLCLGLLRTVAEIATGLPDFIKGWRLSPQARGPMAVVLVLSVACFFVQLWTVVALFQKKRNFRTAYVALWILAVLTPANMLLMLSVPGVTLEMVLPPSDIGRSAAAVIGMGFWFWYICWSERVKNTLVN